MYTSYLLSTFHLLILLTVLLVQIEFANTSTVIINVPGYAAKLQGTTGQSLYTNKTFYAFRSVFYGEKPTNLTRFLPPVPKAPYPPNTLINATVDNAGCPQLEGSEAFGDENCLSLNIFTRQLPTSSVFSNPNLPVMFWIHGGSFCRGYAAAFGPERLMEEDIVLVVIQYRLGPLGWLTLGTDDAPGNAGIFDMIEALRWVNKHISSFGGDPNQVTISGQSAGAISVTLLLLAPQARGLFRGAIAESGTILPSYVYTSTNVGTVAAESIASIAGCPNSTAYKDILKCVKNIDSMALTSAYIKYSYLQVDEDYNLGLAGSSPVIQTAGVQRALQDEPEKVFASGKYSKVPVMIGTNKQEGSFILSDLYYGLLGPNNLLTNSTFLSKSLVLTLLRAFGYIGMNETNNSLVATYTETYLAGTNPNNFTTMIPGLTDLCSVIWLKDYVLKTAQNLTAQGSSVYLYSFQYYGRDSYYDTYWFPPPYNVIPRGVTHGDDVVYLFKVPLLSPLNSTEIAFSKQLLNVWTNFVKYGDPTPYGNTPPGIPKFSRFTIKRQEYLVINEAWSATANYSNTYLVTSH